MLNGRDEEARAMWVGCQQCSAAACTGSDARWGGPQWRNPQPLSSIGNRSARSTRCKLYQSQNPRVCPMLPLYARPLAPAR